MQNKSFLFRYFPVRTEFLQHRQQRKIQTQRQMVSSKKFFEMDYIFQEPKFRSLSQQRKSKRTISVNQLNSSTHKNSCRTINGQKNRSYSKINSRSSHNQQKHSKTIQLMNCLQSKKYEIIHSQRNPRLTISNKKITLSLQDKSLSKNDKLMQLVNSQQVNLCLKNNQIKRTFNVQQFYQAKQGQFAQIHIAGTTKERRNIKTADVNRRNMKNRNNPQNGRPWSPIKNQPYQPNEESLIEQFIRTAS